MKKHFKITVDGVVQGVFFRASAKEKADELGITGFVRNETDGSVYIEAEGDVANVKIFIQWCQQGPPRAKVGKFEVKEDIPKDFGRFIIER